MLLNYIIVINTLTNCSKCSHFCGIHKQIHEDTWPRITLLAKTSWTSCWKNEKKHYSVDELLKFLQLKFAICLDVCDLYFILILHENSFSLDFPHGKKNDDNLLSTNCKATFPLYNRSIISSDKGILCANLLLRTTENQRLWSTLAK